MSKKLMIGSFLALSAIALGTVLYGVLTNDEPGLTTPNARWKKSDFPLRVSTQAYSIKPDDHDHAVKRVRDAIEQTNGRLGFTAFADVDDDSEATIAVTVGVPQNVIMESPREPITASFTSAREPGGSYELRGMGGFWDTCIIETSNTGTDALLSLTLQHELGHCLGLAHDESKLSIMRKKQTLKPMGVRISDSDRKLLRDMYR